MATRGIVVGNSRIVAGGYNFGTDTGRHVEKLIELDEVVAERAGDGRAPGEILVNEWFNHLLFETLLEVDDVVRDPKMLSDIACVVDVVERAAAPGRPALGRQFWKTPLVPELHREPNNTLAAAMQQACSHGAVHSAGHGNGDGAFRDGVFRH